MKTRLILIGFVCSLLLSGPAMASENERYRAIRTSPSGPVLILDTKEGHLWTWNNVGIEETDATGANPRIRYQGNVRKNMKVPMPSSPQIPQSAKDKTRF